MRRVDPKVYTEEYYLSDASGFNEYKRSFGKILEPRFKTLVAKLPPVNGLKVLDVGCGRGELVFWCVCNGAKRAVGIDYSTAAIKLSNRAKKVFNKSINEKVDFIKMDGKHLKFKDQSFDAVILTEVLEHLYPDEQEILLNEIYRVLAKNGFVFIHTAPSEWFNDYTYRYWCYPVSSLLVYLNNLITGHDYGNLSKYAEIRTESHKIMHVNEPNYFSLKKLFRHTGFKGKLRSTNVTVAKPIYSWKDSLFNFLVYFIPLSNFPPFNIIWGNDFYAILRKK